MYITPKTFFFFWLWSVNTRVSSLWVWNPGFLCCCFKWPIYVKKNFSVVNSLLRGSTLTVNISQKNWFSEKLKKDEFRGGSPLSTLKISAILKKVNFLLLLPLLLILAVLAVWRVPDIFFCQNFGDLFFFTKIAFPWKKPGNFIISYMIFSQFLIGGPTAHSVTCKYTLFFL